MTAALSIACLLLVVAWYRCRSRYQRVSIEADTARAELARVKAEVLKLKAGALVEADR